MIISLIGMSGAGKTYWTNALEKNGFLGIHCDKLIENKLKPVLEKNGYHGIKDVAKWMGQPFYKEYPETSTTYLQFEADVVKDILSSLKKYPIDTNIVIDTTGSLIYISKKIQEELKKQTFMISLDVPEKVKDLMYKLYLRDPKPVIWGDSFEQKEGESNYVALSRCYPKLLASRTKKYQQLADITFDYYELRRKKFSVEDFLKTVDHEIHKHH